MQARDVEKALDGFTRAVQLDPENGEAWNNIACLYAHFSFIFYHISSFSPIYLYIFPLQAMPITAIIHVMIFVFGVSLIKWELVFMFCSLSISSYAPK